MTPLVALAAGLIAGMLAVALAWRHLVETRAARQLEQWRAEGDRSAVLQAVESHRAGIKGQLGTELAPLLPAFPFEPADTRFLGHPAQFVIFAGHTAVKDRRRAEMAEVVFVSLSSEGAEAEDARLLEECIHAGRLRWTTLRVVSRPADAAVAAGTEPAKAPGAGQTFGKTGVAPTRAVRGGRRR